MSDAWVFVQLGGDNKTLTLAGLDAPHGRPRQKPIVTDGIELREFTGYYSGNNLPTRHLFGTKQDTITLTGRIMDRYGGAGYAERKVEFIKAFVADQIPVRLTWGSTISLLGIIKKFEPGRESRAEITYSFDVLIDKNELEDTRESRADSTPQSPGSLTDAIEKAIAGAIGPAQVQPSQDQADPFKYASRGLLDNLTSLVQASFGTLATVAGQMQDFEQAQIGDIRRFRASLGLLKTSLITFRDTYQDFRSDIELQGDFAEDSIRMSDLQAQSGQATLEAMIAIVEADRVAELVERGRIDGLYEAKDGDTWESISRSVFGSADRSDDIRLANGIPPGTGPEAGAIYQVPK